MTTTNQTVAKTIALQLGNLAFAMMGAKELVAVENGLQFRIGRNAKGVSKVIVTLDPTDTYTVAFYKMAKKGGVPTVTKLAEVSDVYSDSLKKVIESNTSLYLSL